MPPAAGTARVPFGAPDLASAARSHGTKVWLVAGTGRVLPERLFQSLLRTAGEDDDVELLAADAVDQVVGPTGVEPPAPFTRRADCAIAPELPPPRGMTRG